MNLVQKIDPANRRILSDLFAQYKRQRVIIDAVIDYGYGTAYTDSANSPKVALLKFGYFSLLAGDPKIAITSGLVRELSDTMFIPECDSWRDIVMAFYENRLRMQRRVGFDFCGLDIDYLEELSRGIPKGYKIHRIDEDLVSDDMSAHSAIDLLERGVGYCAVVKEKVVCEAYSYTQTDQAIEVEVGTDPDHRRRGLATATSATLLAHCLKHGIAPHWNASNAESVGLAEKLGYIQADVYEALFPWLS